MEKTKRKLSPKGIQNYHFVKKKQKLNLDDLLFLVNLKFLYPTAMSLKESVRPKSETNFNFAKNFKD